MRGVETNGGCVRGTKLPASQLLAELAGGAAPRDLDDRHLLPVGTTRALLLELAALVDRLAAVESLVNQAELLTAKADDLKRKLVGG
jgi:hypothetical protein